MTATAVLDHVIEELDRFPAQPLIAMQTIRLVTDPDASAAQLGRLVEVDPALSARVMRLANSPYYGLTGRVTTPSRAVVLLGFTTVQAVAMAASAGLLEEVDLADDPFWLHSLAVAASASTIAADLHLSAGEAFNAGLLHDIGRSLLERLYPDTMAEVDAAVALGRSRLDAEVDLLGTNHAEVGSAALKAWRLPAQVVRAVAGHHGSGDRRRETLARVLCAAESLSELVEPGIGDAEMDAAEALDPLGLRLEVQRLQDLASRELDRLVGFLAKGARA